MVFYMYILYVKQQHMPKIILTRQIGTLFLFFSQNNCAPDSIHQDVLVVATSLERGEAGETRALDVLALDGEGLRVVIRNESLASLVVEEGLLDRRC